MVAVSTHERERARLALQEQLDKLKAPAERNKLGQFATPPALASDILAYARTLLGADEPVRFLDPAIGTGAFYSALLRMFPPERIHGAMGYEIDPHYGVRAQELWDRTGLTITIEDFTVVEPPDAETERATLLVCNPPYVRHHRLTAAQKIRLRQRVEQVAHVRLSGLAGLYCYFLCLSHAWMAHGSVAGWLIPSEFMDVNYGQQVKDYLLRSVTLLRIHRFDPHDVQFDDALVSSAVVWFRKTPPPLDHTVEFTYGGTLADPRISCMIPRMALWSMTKWSTVPMQRDPTPAPLTSLRLADLFSIQRGVATGSNSFFILTPEDIRAHELPRDVLTPILPSPRFVPTDEIMADATGDPHLERRLYLLNCSLPEDDVRARYPQLWRYLETGRSAGIHEQYLCAHRRPWYSQENRPPSQFLCTYMGRSNVRAGQPFRFLLNHSRATVANTYLILYPKPVLTAAIDGRPERIRAVWNALRAITPDTLTGEGRVYGGGLHKMEPNELGNASAALVVAALPDLTFEKPVRQLRLLEATAKQMRKL